MIKNKFLFSVLIAVFVLASLGGVLAKDIAYIARDSSHVDSSIVSLLDQGSYSYDIIYQNALDSTDFADYSIILVGDGLYSDYTKIPVNTKNSVILNTYYMDEWLWAKDGVSTKSSNVPSQVVVFDNSSSITNGISEYFTPYASSNEVIVSYDLRYISKIQDAPGLVTIVADDTYFLHLIDMNTPTNGAVVAVMNNGSLLRDNQISKARGVFLGFSQTKLWTAQTKQIFYNSLDWAISGEDKDLDGFFTDMDCNDYDNSINPNATEVPYNHLDENCDGYDLADKDQDQYCKIGYAIEDKDLQCPEETGSMGTDCNDNNSEYNPGSADLTKNCVNDAPVISNINKIIVQETETANLYVNASDSENNNMTYSINDSRFVQDSTDKTHFTWLTNYTNEGNYDFFVKVSDGTLFSEKKFGVRVTHKNKIPDLLMNIPPQEWNEDGNHTLDLTQYFGDIDNNTLYYSVNSTSENFNVHLRKIENGIAYFDSAKDWFGEDWMIFTVSDGSGEDSYVNSNNVTLIVLPVNDAPILLKSIGTINTDEDIVYNLNLSKYFYDVDSVLNYTFKNTSHTNLELNGNILSITPKANWHEEDEAEINVSDGEYNLTEDFIINVNSVNDAPVVNLIDDKYVLAGGNVSFNASATDVEGDPITFSINDSRFVQNENNFLWQTGERDFGVHNFRVAGYDGMNYGYVNVKINVLQKIFINELVWGNEGWIEVYNPENTSFSLSNCAITNGDEDLPLYGTLGQKGYAVFGWNALKNNGALELSCDGILIDTVEYEQFDIVNSYGRKTDGAIQFVLFDFPTKGVSNSADVTKPAVVLISPINNSLFTETRDVTFNFTASDNMADVLSCSIFANAKSLETEDVDNDTQGSFFIDYLPDGIYTWDVECSDGTNKNTAQNSWTVNISAPDAPVLNYISNQVVSENSNLRFYVYASDQDNDPLTLTVTDIPDGAQFTDNKNGNGVFVWTPNYNQSGIYSVKFTATDNTGLSDSQTITILVGNAKEPPKFSDADVCSSKNSSIEITVRDPNKGDDFSIGESINGTIKIRNKFEDSRDFDVHVYLYDLKEEESVDEYEGTIDLSDGESGSVDFSLVIPTDTKNKDFAVYVYVESDEDECNSNYINININRKKHDVIIKDVTADLDSVFPGDQLGVEVSTENLGKNNEDVTILLQISSLGVSQTSDKFIVEKYGNKDTHKETFYITIPTNANIGNYYVNATVLFSGGKNSKSTEFSVVKTADISGTTQNDVINTGSDSKGTPLVLGKPSSGSSGSGTPLVLGGTKTTTTKARTSIFSRKTVNLGVKEQSQKEYIPNVKVQFDGDSNTVKNSNWLIILAIVLGLLVIVIFILIVMLR
jgi:hypothetical protein